MASTSERDRLRLLLVEDNPGDARLLAERLRASRLAVGIRHEESLADAVAALSEGPFDVCLLDLNLPDSRGAETVERMRAAADGLPIVVLTGLADLEAASEAYRAGAVDYLVKDEVSPHAVERTLQFVSERLRTWKTLAEAEEKWATVFELLPVGVVVSDAASGRLIEMNRAFCEILGQKREEMIGETSFALGHWEEPERRRQLVERVRAEGLVRDEEAWIRRADGTRGLMLLSCRRLEVAGADRLLWTVQDVTERRGRERALEETTWALRERVKEQACLHDVSRILHGTERPLAEKLQAVAERLPAGWLHPEVASARVCIEGVCHVSEGFVEGERLATAIEVGGEQVGSVELHYREERPEQDHGPFLDEERALLEEVAERIGVEIERQRTRREMERLVATMTEAVVITDREGRLTFANPAAEELLGLRPADLEGRAYDAAEFHITAPDGSPMPADELPIGRVLATGEPVLGVEHALVGPDGDRLTVSVNAAPIHDATGAVTGVVASARDVTEQRRTEKWRALLANAVEAAANGVMITDASGEIVWVNPEFTRMTGYSREEATGRTPALLNSGVHDDAFFEELWETIAAGDTWRGELISRRRDGSLYTDRQSIVPVRHRSDVVTHYVAIMEDVTEERRRQGELRKSEQRFRALFEESRDPILFSTLEGRITNANTAFLELSGYTVEELRGFDLSEFYVDPEDRHALVNRLLVHGSVSNFETRVTTRSGDQAQVQLTASLHEEEEGTRIQTIIRDVTERRALEEDLRFRAFHDPLTGLANRSLLQERLSLDLARAARSDRLLGLAMLDLSRFKTINESLGHETGDRLLEEVARRLLSGLRPEDTAARLGSDEFVVVVPDVEDREAFAAVVERLMGELRRPYQMWGDAIEVDFNVGIVLRGPSSRGDTVKTTDPEALLRFADIALVVAKETADSTLHWFVSEEDRGTEDLLRREQELRRGLAKREFELFFQPVWDLRSGAVWGCEALARWRHPTRGLLPPDEFIPLAEETDLIHELGHQLCRLAFAEAESWAERLGRDAPYLLLNVSGRQFESERFVEDVEACAAEAGLAPDSVFIEVTESVVTRATGRAEALRELGFGVLIDDFGTGYASFHYLRDLVVDGLKVDKSFVHGVLGDRNERAIAATLLTLGNRLGVLTVAEGVETRAQRDEVEVIGCRLAQGFFLGRPVPADELGELLGL